MQSLTLLRDTSRVACTSERRLVSTGMTTGMKRVLLVDCDAHVLHVLKSSLDRNGYEVDTALSAAAALALLSDHRHDVVLVEADAQGLDSHALVEAILDEPGEALLVLVPGGRPAEWPANSAGRRVETLEKPLSLRYLVGRLGEYFGHFNVADASRG